MNIDFDLFLIDGKEIMLHHNISIPADFETAFDTATERARQMVNEYADDLLITPEPGQVKVAMLIAAN